MSEPIVRKTFSFPADLYDDLELVSRALGFTPSAVLTHILTGSVRPLADYLMSGGADYPVSDVTVPLRRYVGTGPDDLDRALVMLRDYCRWSKGGLNETQLDLL